MGNTPSGGHFLPQPSVRLYGRLIGIIIPPYWPSDSRGETIGKTLKQTVSLASVPLFHSLKWWDHLSLQCGLLAGAPHNSCTNWTGAKWTGAYKPSEGCPKLLGLFHWLPFSGGLEFARTEHWNCGPNFVSSVTCQESAIVIIWELLFPPFATLPLHSGQSSASQFGRKGEK